MISLLNRSRATDQPNRRLARLASLCAAIAIVMATVLTLHSLGILPLVNQVVRVTSLRHLDGFAYYSAIPGPPADGPEPPLSVRENGQTLPFPMSPGYGVVQRLGGGRYHVSGSTIFISATDNSDAATNGRAYTVVRPVPVPHAVLFGFWFVAVAISLGAAALNRSAVWRTITAPQWTGIVLLFLVFVVCNRAWLFVDYPIPAIHPDSSSYFAVAESIGSGAWPNFTIRPAVYPLFMKAIFTAVDRVMAAVFVQTLLSIGASVVLIYAVWLWVPPLGWLAAVAMAGYMSSNAAMEHDTALLSESVYASFLILAFSMLSIAARRPHRWPWFSAASVCMALAILTRPAGSFLFIIFAVVICWMIWNRIVVSGVVAFIVPLPLLALLTCTYNYATVGTFAITAWGEANLAVATFTYWQTDSAYPPQINREISEIQAFVRQRFAESQLDPEVITRSWDPRVLSRAFVLGFHGTPLNTAMLMGGGSYQTTGRVWIRRIAFDSIRKQPTVYLRFVWTMLFNYFHPPSDVDFRAYLMNRVQNLYVDKRYSRANGNPLLVRLGKEFADGTPPRGVVVTNFDPKAPMDLSDRILIAPTAGWRLYDLTHTLRVDVFTSWFWPALLPLAFLVSTGLLLTSRGTNRAAFIAWILSASAIGASLVVCMVEYGEPRYSYPMEWSYAIAGLMVIAAMVQPHVPGESV